MTRVVRARVGYGAGVLAAVAGVVVVFGAGWALIAGGAVMAMSFLLFYDVDEAPAEGPRP